jgi:hypothetical protein
MAITPDFLSRCTDEQINKGVAWAQVSEHTIASKYPLANRDLMMVEK